MSTSFWLCCMRSEHAADDRDERAKGRDAGTKALANPMHRNRATERSMEAKVVAGEIIRHWSNPLRGASDSFLCLLVHILAVRHIVHAVLRYLCVYAGWAYFPQSGARRQHRACNNGTYVCVRLDPQMAQRLLHRRTYTGRHPACFTQTPRLLLS
jgi:hypothetical protein